VVFLNRPNLVPRTGVDSTQAIDAANGVELYLRKIGARAGGRVLELVKEDDEAKPEVALAKLKKMVERDAIDFAIGPVSSAVDRAKVRDALRDALPGIQPPRGPMRFDDYRQAITPTYITRTEKREGRLMNVVIDKFAPRLRQRRPSASARTRPSSACSRRRGAIAPASPSR